MEIWANATSPKTTLLRRALRVMWIAILVYVLFVLAIMFCQRRMLYFPTRLQQKVAEQIAAREGLTPWKNKGGQIIGWKLSARTTANGAVLIVHGNGGCALDRIYFAKPIHDAAPVDVYLLEYPGYGARVGSPSQKSFLAAAEEAIDLLTNRMPIYVVAESLGTGVAAHLANVRSKQVSGLMLIAPYDNLVSVAQQKMPLFPVSLILWDRYDPATWLKSYRSPVGFVLAAADQVIPEKFGRRLHDGYGGPKHLQIIPDAGHNDVADQSVEWWKNIFLFWQQHGQTKEMKSTDKP